jgi:2-C-methyl-D-erythritol 4-phosphate cytidylyltransferase
VIAAAGSGQRLGAGGPKAFVELAGRPMLEWSLDAFRAAGTIAEIVVAAPPGQDDAVAEEGVLAVAGAEHRSESVANALELCAEDIVVVHDAARPLVTPGLIDAMVEELAADEDVAGVIAATPVTDTIKHVGGDGQVERTVDRSGLWAVQTPQVFRADALRKALGDPDDLPAASDDAMLVERQGGRVVIHSTSPDNVKVTTPFDLRVAELLLRERGSSR